MDGFEQALPEDALETFRREWKAEVSQTQNTTEKSGNTAGSSGAVAAAASAEDRVFQEALQLHRQGATLEHHGMHVEAMEYYRRAAKLVPDIDYQAYRLQNPTRPQAPKPAPTAAAATAAPSAGVAAGKPSGAAPASAAAAPPAAAAPSTGAAASAKPAAPSAPGKPAASAPNTQHLTSAGEDGGIDDLVSAFSRLQPAIETTQRHKVTMADLPRELLLKILLASVEPLGDMQALGQLACVCRAFYLLTNDSVLWQQCAKLVFPDLPRTPAPYTSWRDMCLNRPRPLCHGVYVSRVSYVRPGEQSMDEHYRPFHVVRYFRYLRFFPNGQALTVTSSDPPKTVVSGLKHWDTNLKDCLRGRYQFVDRRVLAKFSRVTAKPPAARAGRGSGGRHGQVREQTYIARIEYFMELEFSEKRRQDTTHRLSWVDYTLRQFLSLPDDPGESSSVALNEHFKPFQFIRVPDFASA